MSDLYKKNPIYKTIELFCAIRGISISGMCKVAGVSPGLVTDLKMGRKQTIQIETASKIAGALKTDVDTLMNNSYNIGFWDVDTCLKWTAAEMREEYTYLLEEYGVDLEFLLDKKFPERKSQLESVVFNQGHVSKKEKSPTPEGVGLIPGYYDLTAENKLKAQEYIEMLLKLQ